MIASTTSPRSLAKLKSALIKAAVILFWLTVWELVAIIVGKRFILPAPTEVILYLAGAVFTADFWLNIVFTLLRILAGFALGTMLGILLALLCSYAPLYHLVRPIITVTRCTPVASFIMIMWLLLKDPYIPSTIALLMVLPVIFESAYSAVASPTRDLTEIADVFEFSRKKRLIYLTLPTVVKATLPSIITASGLAWKAGVAAEIITYTENSIGQSISIAKSYLQSAELFAWTAVVVALSLIFEAIIKHFSGKAAKLWEYR